MTWPDAFAFVGFMLILFTFCGWIAWLTRPGGDE